MYSQIFSWINNYHEQESWLHIFEKTNTFKYNIKFIVYIKIIFIGRLKIK